MDLYWQGNLTDTAQSVLKAELALRGETIPAERMELAQEQKTQKPLLVRILTFLALWIAITFFWLAVIKPVISGAVPTLLFVGVPTLILFQRLFLDKTPANRDE